MSPACPLPSSTIPHCLSSRNAAHLLLSSSESSAIFNASPSTTPKAPPFSFSLSSFHRSISFATLSLQPAPLLRVPLLRAAENEAFKANYLVGFFFFFFLIQHRSRALQEVRPGDFVLFLVAVICRLWLLLSQQYPKIGAQLQCPRARGFVKICS